MKTSLPVFLVTSFVAHGALIALWQADFVTARLPVADTPMTVSLAAPPRDQSDVYGIATTHQPSTPPPALPAGPVAGTAITSAAPPPVAASEISPGADLPDPPPSPREPRPDDAATDTRAQVYAELSDAIAQHFHYPAVARQRGWQGRVRLSVHIAPDGYVRQIRVLDSSGYRVLDHAAMRSLQQVAWLPGVAGWSVVQGFDMVVPVEYRLIDS